MSRNLYIFATYYYKVQIKGTVPCYLKSLTSREVIDKLKAAVEEHRAGADPNDDLTLMCITLKQ